MINRKKLFDGIRDAPFNGTMAQRQVDGVNKIIDEWERRKLTDLRWLAYILATAKWETDHTMQPIREKGGEDYLRSKRYYPWVGEGLVQVTWKTNHAKFGATAPGQMLTWPIALRAIYDGMIGGMFTSKKLSDYFNATKTDWYNARRTVNGTDKAQTIADIAKMFYKDLVMASDPDTTTAKDAVKIGVGAAGSALVVGGAAVAVQQGVNALTICLWIGGISLAAIAAIVVTHRIKKGFFPWKSTSTGNQSQVLSPPSHQNSEPFSEQVLQAQSELQSAGLQEMPLQASSELTKLPKPLEKPSRQTPKLPRKSSSLKPNAAQKFSLKRKLK